MPSAEKDAPFVSYACVSDNHDACNGVAWVPDIPCECQHHARVIPPGEGTLMPSAENDAPEYHHPGRSWACRWRGDGWFYRDGAGYEHACDWGDHPRVIPPGEGNADA